MKIEFSIIKHFGLCGKTGDSISLLEEQELLADSIKSLSQFMASSRLDKVFPVLMKVFTFSEYREYKLNNCDNVTTRDSLAQLAHI